jgi:DNA-binding NarL/FixJ family response regulator
LVTLEPVRVLVLYSHPLMGEGLGSMLAAEPGVVVDAVDITVPGAVDAALAREPAVIVVEEGGAIDAADIVRRSSAAVVMDVDINTTRAWTLRRETLVSRPDEFLAAIRAVVAGAGRPTTEPEPDADRRSDADRRPGTDRRPDGDRGLTPVIVPG